MKVLLGSTLLALSLSAFAAPVYETQTDTLESRLCLEVAIDTKATKNFIHSQGFKCSLNTKEKDVIKVQYEYIASEDNADTRECLRVAKSLGKTSSFTTRNGLRCTLSK